LQRLGRECVILLVQIFKSGRMYALLSRLGREDADFPQ